MLTGIRDVVRRLFVMVAAPVAWLARRILALFKSAYRVFARMVAFTDAHPVTKFAAQVTTFAGFATLAIGAYYFLTGTPPGPPADAQRAEQPATASQPASAPTIVIQHGNGGEEKLLPLAAPLYVASNEAYRYDEPFPRFNWRLVYYYDGNARSIYGKGHAYSGTYAIDGMTGFNIYANMKAYFYGVDSGQLVEWNDPVETGFLNSYTSTPTQEFGVNRLPRLILVCMEYDAGKGPRRAVSSFARDSLNGSDIFFNDAGPVLIDEVRTDAHCASSISKYLVDNGIMRAGEIQVKQVYGRHDGIGSHRFLTAAAISNVPNSMVFVPSFTDDRLCMEVRDLAIAGGSNDSMKKLMTFKAASQAEFGSYSCTNHWSRTDGIPPKIGAADDIMIWYQKEEWQSYIVTCAALISENPGYYNVRFDYFHQGVDDVLIKANDAKQEVVEDKDYCQNPERWPRSR